MWSASRGRPKAWMSDSLIDWKKLKAGPSPRPGCGPAEGDPADQQAERHAEQAGDAESPGAFLRHLRQAAPRQGRPEEIEGALEGQRAADQGDQQSGAVPDRMEGEDQQAERNMDIGV